MRWIHLFFVLIFCIAAVSATIDDLFTEPTFPKNTDDVRFCAKFSGDFEYPRLSTMLGAYTLSLPLKQDGEFYCRNVSAITLGGNDGDVVDYYVSIQVEEELVESDIKTFTIDGLEPEAILTCTKRSGREPLQVTCTSTSIDTVDQELQHTWSTGETTTEINLEYRQEGTHTITLLVQDDARFTDAAAWQITVLDSEPTAIFDFETISTEDGETIQFTDLSVVYDEYTREWNFGDGPTPETSRTSTEANPTFKFLRNDVYDVSLTITEADEDTNTLRREVAIEDIDRNPVITSNPPTTATTGSLYTYILNAIDPEGLTVTIDQTLSTLLAWMTVDGLTIQGTPTEAGEFPVTVVVTDSEKTAEQSYNLNINEGIIITDISASEAIPGEEITITVTIQNNGEQAEYELQITGPFGDKNKTITLQPGETTETLTLTVPALIPAGDHIITIELAGLTRTITVNVVRDEEIVVEATLSENALSCVDTTNIEVTITNLGGEDIIPEIIITDGTDELARELSEALPSLNSQTYTLPIEVARDVDSLSLTVKNGDDIVTETSFPVTRSDCLGTSTPEETQLLILDGTEQTFTIQINDPAFDVSLVEWYIDNVLQGTGDTFTYTFDDAGEFEIEVRVNDEVRSWTVTVTDVPVDLDQFGFTDPITDPTSVQLTLENEHAKVVFTNPIDLSEILYISELATLEERSITLLPPLDVEATITFHNIPQGINTLKVDNTICTDCFVSHTGTEYIFEAAGSIYSLTAQRESTLTAPANVDFTSNTASITITNTGTVNPLDLTYDVTNLQYSPVLTNAPATLAPGSRTFTVTFTNPQAGNVGTLKINWNGQTTLVTLTHRQPTYLELDNLEINGKSSGDFNLDNNKITFDLKNTYHQDMEIEVNVEIQGIDDQDEDIDIKDGDKESLTFEFDFSGEDLDDEKYDLEITVKGTADDGTKHTLVEKKVVDLKLPRHELTIKRAFLTQTELSCSKTTELDLLVKNTGKSDEKDLTVKVYDQEKTDIKIDSFFDRRNEYKESFFLDLNDLTVGDHKIDVEVLDGSEVMASQKLDIKITECEQEKEDVVPSYTAPKPQTMDEQPPKSTTRSLTPFWVSSFRDSDEYLLVLAIIIIIATFALILGLLIFARK